VLEQPDLAAALVDLVREWRVRHPDIELNMTLEGDLGDLGEGLTLAVFRAVQEALTNVLRHAGASTVGLFVATRDGHLEATIEDDGQGATEGLTGAGVGLVGMRERVVALGGRLPGGSE
jgi:signal transduction histidine kinase